MNAIVYLYIIVAGYNTPSPNVVRTQFPTMEACEAALKSSKQQVSSGAESENVLVTFCGGENFQEQYNGYFHQRTVFQQ